MTRCDSDIWWAVSLSPAAASSASARNWSSVRGWSTFICQLLGTFRGPAQGSKGSFDSEKINDGGCWWTSRLLRAWLLISTLLHSILCLHVCFRRYWCYSPSGPGTVQRGQAGSSLSLSCRFLGGEAQRDESHVPESAPCEFPLLDTPPPRQRPSLVCATALQRLVASFLSHHAMTSSYRCLLPEWCCCFEAKVEKVEKLVFPVEMLYNKNMWMTNLSLIKVI